MLQRLTTIGPIATQRKSQMKTLLVCLAVSLPTVSLGADSNPDSSFYTKSAEGGMAEVDQGMLAQDGIWIN
jgi:hypothetical protein